MENQQISLSEPAPPCRLCRLPCEPQESHVIPAFVFRWLKESSGDGHIRNTVAPNLRSQDGEKRYWLCSVCEQRFSNWEGDFASKIFHPYLKGSGETFQYEDWLLRFAVSVSWRVLLLQIEEGGVENWPPLVALKAQEAELAWRKFLIGETSNPGEFRQHVIPMDEVSGFGEDTPPNINRYLMRAVDLAFPFHGSQAHTYVKMGRFIFIGHVIAPHPNRWRSVRINANAGEIRPRKYELPMELWDFIKGRARKVMGSLASMSEKQHRKVEAAFRENLDRYEESDSFKAMTADVKAFGKAAFGPSTEPK